MRDVDATRPWTRLYPDWVPNELPLPPEPLADVLEAVARRMVPGSRVGRGGTTSELDMLGSEPPAAVFAASRKAAPPETVDLLAALDRTTADPAARVPVAPSDLASLGYTSGTTGQ